VKTLSRTTNVNHRHRASRRRDGEFVEPAGRRLSRLRTVRGRIVVILALPTALLVAISVYGVLAQARQARDASGTSATVDLVLADQELVHSLQRERGLSVGVAGGAYGFRAALATQRRTSDTARISLDRLLSTAGSQSAARVRTGEGKLNELSTVRGEVDAGLIVKADVFGFYTTAIRALNDAAFEGNVDQSDAGLRQGMQALQALSDAKEYTGEERAVVNGVFAAGSFAKGDYAQFTELRAAKLAGFENFLRLAAPGWSAALGTAQRTPEAMTAAGFEERALAEPTATHLGVNSSAWWAAMTTFIDDLHGVQLTVGRDERARAQQVKSTAIDNLTLYGVGAVLTLLAAVVLGLVTFRSIVRPLRTLTAEARDAAEQKLPDAVARIQSAEDPSELTIEASTSALAGRADEFAEVAGALDRLRETAVRLAVEQAVMRHNTAESLANLGRRNQNLVRRQLGFITNLERAESDPNALANLFELDHLATRMRRNAESLLVLVGERSPRRWTSAVPVGDVLRSAFSEVEDYRRVILRRADDTNVRGAAAAELSHLLAELVENALTFSPPDQEVEVHARGAAAGYHIAIVDQGIGMSEEAIANANARLRGEQSFLVTPTRDLGHYVVGRLAARLGVRVWLHDSPLNGVTARVVIPASLLEAEDPPEAPATPLNGRNVLLVPPDQHALPQPGGVAVAIASGPAEPEPYGDMTRNGLVRRRPGETRLPARPLRPVRTGHEPAVLRSPAEVRNMLDNLRSGVNRAERGRDDSRDS
jgi:signal transduction histidine kinase